MGGDPLALGTGFEQDLRRRDSAERRGELGATGGNPLVANGAGGEATTELALAFV